MDNMDELVAEIKGVVEAFNRLRLKYNLIHSEWVKAVKESDFRLARLIMKDMERIEVPYHNHHLQLINYKAYLRKVNKPEKYIAITGAGYF